MKMCPEAKMDDGLLDVTYVQNVEPDQVPELMQVVLAGKKKDELSKSIKTMRVEWLEVTCTMCGMPAVLHCHQNCGSCHLLMAFLYCIPLC